MGGGVAVCFADAGSPVTLVDANDAALSAGSPTSTASTNPWWTAAGSRRKTRRSGSRGYSTSFDYDQLRDADVIVEAVFEGIDLKREEFAKLDAVARRGAVLATNTSTLVSRPSPSPLLVRKM